MRILLAPFVFLNAIFYGLASLVAFPLGKLMIGVGFDLADALMVVRQTRFYMTILCWVIVMAWMLGTGPFDRTHNKDFNKNVKTVAPK